MTLGSEPRKLLPLKGPSIESAVPALKLIASIELQDFTEVRGAGADCEQQKTGSQLLALEGHLTLSTLR